MKLIILVACALVAVAVAAPSVTDPIAILRSEVQQQPEGNYNFNFETADGVSRQETGEVKEALDEDKKPHSVVAVRGSFSYTDPDGKPQLITYTADEFGFHAEGDSIPKVPVARR